MKKVKCSYKGCSNRRPHFESQETARPHQAIEVPDDFPEDGKAYCSIECACYDGAYSVKSGWIKDA